MVNGGCQLYSYCQKREPDVVHYRYEAEMIMDRAERDFVFTTQQSPACPDEAVLTHAGPVCFKCSPPGGVLMICLCLPIESQSTPDGS